METIPNFPTYESPEVKLKKDINDQLSSLLKKGTRLADIVDILDAQEFLENIEAKKGQPPVAHFDVDKFIEKRTSEKRKIALPEEYIKLDEVILPPSEMEMKTGSGNGFKEAGIIPRSTMLMETLAELGLKYSIIEGKNDPKMVRKLSYLVFNVPSIGKLVLVNDEEGNATFIIHKAEEEEWKDYMKKTKEELSKMPYNLVSSINYPDKNKEGHEERWKGKISDLILRGPLLPKEAEEYLLAPEGWMTMHAIGLSLGIGDKLVKGIVDKFREDRPEWFVDYRTKPGNVREHFGPELIEILKAKAKKLESIQEAPEGWLTRTAMSHKFDFHSYSIQKEIEKHQKDHPEWIKEFKVRGKISIVKEHLHPMLVDLIKEELSKELPPKDWMSAKELAGQVGVSDPTLKKYIDQEKVSHPEWAKTFKNLFRQDVEYYHPELVKLIKDKLGAVDQAPESWTTINKLAQQLGIAFYTLKNNLEAYRRAHPDWFKMYRNQAGQSVEHLHPNFVEIIKKEQEEIKEAPEGWLTTNATAQSTGIAFKTVRKIAKELELIHPEWVKTFRSKTRQQTAYYSPELIKLIRDRYLKVEHVPEGWMTASALSQSLNIYIGTLQKHSETYRKEHPEWFKIYKNFQGKELEYYAPRLVDILRDEYENIELAPNGWMLPSQLSKEFGMSIKTLQKKAASYKSTHFEWFKKFKAKNGVIKEHYSPELAEILKKKPNK